jgi:hypothetical protein
MGERRSGVLDGYDVVVRPVDSSWYPDFIGAAIDFYQGRPPAYAQIVWPDREGRFPWDDGAPFSSSQPQLWLPRGDHPEGKWTELRGRLAWPFEDGEPDQGVFVSNRLAAGESSISEIVHYDDGDWAFLDDGPCEVDDVSLIHFHHVVADFPEARQFAKLPAGQRASRGPDGTWSLSAVPTES